MLGLRVASGVQGGTLNVDFGGVNKTGTLTVPNTGGWETFETMTTTVQLTAGQQIMQVDFDSNGATGYVGNFNWLDLTADPIVASAGSNFSANAGATATFAGTVSGGSAPYSYGWTFGDGATSSGSPTPSHVYANPGTYTATLTAQDNFGDIGTSSVVVTVNDVAPSVTLTAPTSGEAGVSESFSATATDISPAVQAAGFTYSWVFGDGGTATGASPSHTFAVGGTYTVTVSATDEYGKTGTASGTIVIASGETPYGGTPWPVPGLIQAENFDNGGEGVAYFTPHPGAGGDPYRHTLIGIQPTTDTGGGYNVGWIYATEWLNYTINVAAAGTYVLGLRVASGVQGGTLNVDFGGVNESGTLTVPNTGGWETFQTLTTTVQLSAGQQIMQVDFDSNGATGYVGNFNWLDLTADPIVASAGSNFSANAGATATFAGTVSGGTAPYSYGWTFGDGATSSGSPTPSHVYANPGTYTATLTAQDNFGDVGTSSVLVTVNDVAPSVTLTAPTSGEAGVSESFSASATDISPAVQAAGFTYSWVFGDGGTATGASPSHTFAVGGTYTVTVSATDEYGKTGTASGTIVIASGETPYGGTPWPVPGLIQAENFDNGGEGVAYFTPHPVRR